MNEKKCGNCAWFCHADGNCYGMHPDGDRVTIFGLRGNCSYWTADGLSDEERAELYPETALMTMVTA